MLPVKNSQMATGTQTGQAPITGKRDMKLITNPQKIGPPTPTRAKPTAQMLPCTTAITRLMFTLA